MTPAFTALIVLDIVEPEGLEEDFVAQVLVSGTGPLPYAVPFAARFDAEPVEAVAVVDGSGFTGYLKNKPAEGTKLFVEFDGEDPLDTGLVYPAAGPIA